MEPFREHQLAEELLTRGVERIYPSTDFLRDRLLSGERLRVYLGIDPTGPTLHLGHAIPLKKLAEFQALGHEIILLIGDFTATIGDPTDKMAVRTPLTREQVLENARRYKEQASVFLDFNGENPAQIRYNSEWLAPLSFADTLKLAAHTTYAQIIKRDMFQKRIQEGKDLFLHEFLYPLMQGYDSVAMEVDGEIGGNDQTFNMLVGRDLLKKMKGKEKFVLSTKILADTEGAKMGKTTGNILAFTDSPEEMFGKVMSWGDAMIVPGFELCTNRPSAEIREIEKELASGINPLEKKLALAWDVVFLYYDAAAADAARETFRSVVQQKEIPKRMKEIEAGSDEKLSAVVVRAGIKPSVSAYRKDVEAGGVHDLDIGRTIEDFQELVGKPRTLRIGKRAFLKIKVRS